MHKSTKEKKFPETNITINLFCGFSCVLNDYNDSNHYCPNDSTYDNDKVSSEEKEHGSHTQKVTCNPLHSHHKARPDSFRTTSIVHCLVHTYFVTSFLLHDEMTLLFVATSNIRKQGHPTTFANKVMG